MKKIYISKNYRDRYTASSKAKLDCECIVAQCGFVNIGLESSFYANEYLGRLRTVLSNLIAYMRMPKQGIAFLQYPVFGYKWQMMIAKKKMNKVITIIHDLNILRGAADFVDKEALEQSDVLIAHTPEMKKWCLNNLKCKDIVVLGIFDYLSDKGANADIIPFDSSNVTVAFAGNLGKSVFLDKLHLSHVQFNLFGIGINTRNLDKCCVYRGCYPPDELGSHLKSMFGLVWDGDSIDECLGVNGKYLRYIAPHKTSMYLSCGIPVIVWKKSALTSFVEEKNIGIAIDSLKHLEEILTQLTKEDYQNMISNVMKIKEQLLGGYFLKTAIAHICNF